MPKALWIDEKMGKKVTLSIVISLNVCVGGGGMNG